MSSKTASNGPKNAPGIVADPLQAEGFAAMRFVHRSGDERVARRRARARAKPVEQPTAEHALPD